MSYCFGKATALELHLAYQVFKTLSQYRILAVLRKDGQLFVQLKVLLSEGDPT
jgi:hypothetical protein